MMHQMARFPVRHQCTIPHNPGNGKKHMALLRRRTAFALAALTVVISLSIEAQVGDPATLAREKLASQIKLTKTTADHSDIVTAGDIVLLHKDGLMMCSTASSYAYSNSYANGVLAPNLNNRTKDAAKAFFKGRLPFGGGGSAADAANNGCASRKFVAGEKFWISGITLQKDGILVSTFSDPYSDVRYYGEIKFPFAKGSVPAADDFAKTVAEVITVVPSDDKGGSNDQQTAQNSQSAPAPSGGQQAKPAAAAAPLPDIAPPPPPPDAAPPTIAVGQTKDQVSAAFGQPARMAKLGAKEIYYYKDMKVTFTNGKVSNVE
jgi:hypothetical protein